MDCNLTRFPKLLRPLRFDRLVDSLNVRRRDTACHVTDVDISFTFSTDFEYLLVVHCSDGVLILVSLASRILEDTF